MKIKVLIFFSVISLNFISCSDNVSPFYGLNQVFEIKYQTSVTVNNNFVIFFEEFNENRCPSDAECLAPGNASIKLKVTDNGVTSYAIVLIDGYVTKNDLNYQKDVFIFSYKITFMQLDPYPKANVRYNPADYKATLLVTKI